MNMQATRAAGGAQWIEQAACLGTSLQEALAVFDSLPPISLEAMIGNWRGGGLATGHPLDGLLEAYGWHGKRFTSPDDVDPLVFAAGRGKTVALDPRYLPVALVCALRPHRWSWTAGVFALASRLIRTRQPTARLRMIEHRGMTSAAMIYDRQPIVDHFREVEPSLLMGLMDLRGMPPFFFTLRRE